MLMPFPNLNNMINMTLEKYIIEPKISRQVILKIKWKGKQVGFVDTDKIFLDLNIFYLNNLRIF